MARHRDSTTDSEEYSMDNETKEIIVNDELDTWVDARDNGWMITVEANGDFIDFLLYHYNELVDHILGEWNDYQMLVAFLAGMVSAHDRMDK